MVRAVRGINLTINRGETLALLGPNGAGKTTTIDMMLGLVQPDAGSVSLFGASPRDAVEAGTVSGMLQTGSPPEYLSVRELVTMIASLYPNPLAVKDVLAHVNITEIADRPTNKLSGGQTQRVRMAIALVANSEMLVLDEPTAALDVEGRRDFWESIRDIAAQGKTVIFATHYLEEADAYADRIVLMARGQIVADGPPTEIKARVGGRTIRATLPGSSEALSKRSLASQTPSNAARPSSSSARMPPPPTPRCAHCSISTPKLATSKCAARDSKRPSSTSPVMTRTTRTPHEGPDVRSL